MPPSRKFTLGMQLSLNAYILNLLETLSRHTRHSSEPKTPLFSLLSLKEKHKIPRDTTPQHINLKEHILAVFPMSENFKKTSCEWLFYTPYLSEERSGHGKKVNVGIQVSGRSCFNPVYLSNIMWRDVGSFLEIKGMVAILI